MYQISAQYIKACRRKVRKTVSVLRQNCQYSSLESGITPTKIDPKLQHSNLICTVAHKKKVIYQIPAQSVKA